MAEVPVQQSLNEALRLSVELFHKNEGKASASVNASAVPLNSPDSSNVLPILPFVICVFLLVSAFVCCCLLLLADVGVDQVATRLRSLHDDGMGSRWTTLVRYGQHGENSEDGDMCTLIADDL